MINKLDAILSLVPGAEVVIDGENLIWVNPKKSPVTDEQISAEIARLEAQQPFLIIKAERMAAYRTEADPLFFKAQRGEATMEEWQAKVEEIKQRFPYPA